MPAPDWFDQISLDEVDDLVEEHVPDDYDVRRAYLDGDHWQERDGWIGPHPSDNDQHADVAWDEIERAFTPKGVIGEVVDRHEGGVVGREPLWRFVPRDRDDVDSETGDVDDEVADEIDDLESRLAAWWEDRDVDSVLSEGVDTLLVGSRSILRMFIPRGLLDEAEDGARVVPDGPLDEQLDRIHVEALEPGSGMVYEDPDTKTELGIVVYEVETGNPQRGVAERTENRAELSWVDDDGTTHLRILREGEDDEKYEFEFGGNMLVHELERPALITNQVVRQQRALDLANSMIPRNVITGGFLERILLNAQMPGTVEENEETGEKKFKPDPYHTGPGTTNWVTGIREVDEQEGTEEIKTPKVKFREPVPPDAAIEAKQAHYHDILDEVDQKHVIISGDATPSGESREQARAEYRRSLNRTRTPVEGGVRWLVETSAAMAAFFADDAPDVDALRADVTAVVDDGPVSSEEMRAIAEMINEGVFSKETGLKRLGVREVRAEIDRIEDQENADIKRAADRAEAIQALARAGSDLVTAAVMTGMSEERAEELFGEIDERQRRMEDRREAARAEIGEGGSGENGGPPGEEEPEGEPAGAGATSEGG